MAWNPSTWRRIVPLSLKVRTLYGLCQLLHLDHQYRGPPSHSGLTFIVANGSYWSIGKNRGRKKTLTNRFLICVYRGLTNLVDLDLSGNALASVPTSAVEDCKYLMRLSLRSNPISSVGSEALVGLSELVHLDLSHCGLEEVHPLAFRGLHNLEYLRLEANRLTTLSPTTQSFPPNLR